MQSGKSDSKASSDKKHENTTAKTPTYRDLIDQGIPQTQLEEDYIQGVLYGISFGSAPRPITLDDSINSPIFVTNPRGALISGQRAHLNYRLFYNVLSYAIYREDYAMANALLNLGSEVEASPYDTEFNTPMAAISRCYHGEQMENILTRMLEKKEDIYESDFISSTLFNHHGNTQFILRLLSKDKAFQKLDKKEQETKCNIIVTAYSCVTKKQQPHDYKEHERMNRHKAIKGTVVHVIDPLYTHQIEKETAETKEVKDALLADHLLLPPLIAIVNSYLNEPTSYPHSLSIMKTWVQKNIDVPLPCQLPPKHNCVIS